MYYDGFASSPASYSTDFGVSPLRRLKREVATQVGCLPAQGDDLLLTFRGFRDRLALLVSIGVPCSMRLDPISGAETLARVERLIEAPLNRLCIVGDLFSVVIAEDDIGVVLLQAKCPDKPFISISIRNRSGAPALTLFGAGKASGNALWDDILGNPCQTQDLPESCLNNS